MSFYHLFILSLSLFIFFLSFILLFIPFGIKVTEGVFLLSESGQTRFETLIATVDWNSGMLGVHVSAFSNMLKRQRLVFNITNSNKPLTTVYLTQL